MIYMWLGVFQDMFLVVFCTWKQIKAHIFPFRYILRSVAWIVFGDRIPLCMLWAPQEEAVHQPTVEAWSWDGTFAPLSTPRANLYLVVVTFSESNNQAFALRYE